jgi:CRISPR-associated protein Csb2
VFALEVEYLTGRSVATARDDRQTPEWPPHPGRLFCAMVAAGFECFTDVGGRLDREVEAALGWLEKQSPPALSVSEKDLRSTTCAYVPVNDSNDPSKIGAKGKVTVFPSIAEGSPFRRNRQERTFPSVTPHHPLVHFLWSGVEKEEVESHGSALRKLVARIAYLGHSSSLVRVSLCDQPPEPTHKPDDEGELLLRVPTPGRLRALTEAFTQGRPPSPGMYCAYSMSKPSLPAAQESVFGEAFIFERVGQESLALHLAVKLTVTVRKALMRVVEDMGMPPQEVLSGHRPDGSPSQKPHVAIVPLANVGHRYSNGDILGVAVVLPRGLRRDDPERQHVLAALGGLKQVTLGKSGVWEVRRHVGTPSRHSLEMNRV